MKLLTTEVAVTIPMLYDGDGKRPDDRPVSAKFFLPSTRWTWFVMEGATIHDGCTGFGCAEGAHGPLTEWSDGEDALFYGYVRGLEDEFGYFRLTELEELNVGPFRVERDLYWDPTTAISAVTGVAA